MSEKHLDLPIQKTHQALIQSFLKLLLSPELMAQAYTGALINIARWWVRHKDRASKEEMIRQITPMVRRLYEA